ncbi:MAG: hypothetical protein ACKOWF_02150 [Chloroflexota bacterium]
MFANDVIARWGNQTSRRLKGRVVPHDSHSLDYLFCPPGYMLFGLDPGKESAWNAGWTPKWYGTTSYVWIVEPGERKRQAMVLVECHNPEIGTPSVTISRCEMWWGAFNANPDSTIPMYEVKERIGAYDMPENRIIEVEDWSTRLRIAVHRWTNGKEQVDDYDEWYTRFYVAATPWF